MIATGIERLAAERPGELAGRRLALLCNQASTDSHFRHSRDLLEQTFPGRLVCLFSPQHGFFSEKQDNMIESDHSRDPQTGLVVFSLYSERRRPDPAWFDLFDILLVDLVDVGTRVYTFAWTVIYCLEVAAKTGKKVIILDRPNPIGGVLAEGNLLKAEWASFVGLYSIPMRHGLTLGELAILCNREMRLGSELDVITVQGWRRDMLFKETRFPWVFPSPNMPSAATALVYPGQVLWEGTNISEGRGTTLPFELFGAPFIDPGRLEKRLRSATIPGCVLRPLSFLPGFSKWRGETCKGFQIHVTDPLLFRPYRTSLALLQAILLEYPEQFRYKEPPYEYEFTRLPMDLLLGDQQVRIALEQGIDILEIEQSWESELARFNELRASVFLYGLDEMGYVLSA